VIFAGIFLPWSSSAGIPACCIADILVGSRNLQLPTCNL
jgi:hypothetical protein